MGHTDARVLLLSATPYKMYTLSDESAEDDHYADFTDTVDFLLNGDGTRFRSELADMRRALMNVERLRCHTSSSTPKRRLSVGFAR